MVKTLLLKQIYDCQGPWQSFIYNDKTDSEIIRTFYGKGGSPYEFILQFEVDVAILKVLIGVPWVKSLVNSVPEYKETMESFSKAIDYIDISSYDIIYCRDPILTDIKKLQQECPEKLFVYELCEHTSYLAHFNEGFDYDLYLDHTNRMTDKLSKLPQAINFPYPRCPEKMRKVFNYEKEDKVFFDHRTITLFSTGETNALWDWSKNIKVVEELEDLIEMPIEHNGQMATKYFMFHSPPRIYDAEEYNIKLAKSKYYVSTSGRIGQSVGEAASLGCICIGTEKSELHKLIVHPKALFSNIPTKEDIAILIETIESNTGLQKEILEYQDSQLQENFIDKPKKILYRALDMKKEKKWLTS